MVRHLTYKELNLLDRDGRITEIIKKVFYNHPAPSIWHQDISRNLEEIFLYYLKKHPIGILYDAPVDVILSDENVVQPDLVFILKDNRPIIKEHGIEGVPDLIIEVISDESYDVKKKMPLYATYALKYLWYIFPDEKLIKTYRLNVAKYDLIDAVSEKDSFSHQLFPGLIIDAKKVFRKIL
ncbi:MAG: Uma2 family endonuclease [Bacteroidia bacterium]|nr:Uma2 family endonuclease [Bacteroidia bacterium]